ncbi:MAG: murein biosynthesis integral membrane protein MurJ [Actinomycetota bacterium]
MSRMTGLARSMVVAAVLGATYLGNTYQAINALPNLVYYQLLAGSLFASLLVPPLVPYADAGDRQGARRLVGGFLGVLVAGGLVLSAVVLVAGRPLLELLALAASNPTIAAAQVRVGWFLLLMFVPQILLYVVAGTGAAVMNAHGRFALAAGAPTVESVGIIAVMAAAAVLFGTGTAIDALPMPQLVLLGVGTTASVALHAAFEWLGARSAGVTMVPRRGWRDPEVQRVVRRVLPTLGYTALAAVQILAILVLANRVSGGLVAFQLALSFFYLPSAIVTWPIARALLPRLARRHHAADDAGFSSELTRGLALASFVTVPIAVAYAALAQPIARAVAFGELGTPTGERMVAWSLAALSVAVVGESWFVLGTYAHFARNDPRSAFMSMAVRVSVSVALMVLAWPIRGPGVLVVLGTAFSAGSVAGTLHMWARLQRTVRVSHASTVRSVGRTVAAAALMIGPAFLTARALGALPRTQLSEVITVAAAAVVGIAVFVGAHALLHGPELGWLRGAVARGTGRSRT